MNNRPFKQLRGTRQSQFDNIDKPALAALPKHAYEYTDIKTVKANIDYHIQYDNHLYSVPHHLVGECIEVRQLGPSDILLSQQSSCQPRQTIPPRCEYHTRTHADEAPKTSDLDSRSINELGQGYRW